MSNNKYSEAVAGGLRFFGSVASESDAMTAKLNAYGDRLTGINRNLNAEHAAVFDKVLAESAAGFDFYADGLEKALAGFQSNINLASEGFAERVKDIDTGTEDGRSELGAYRHEMKGLLDTATSTKAKVNTTRGAVKLMHDSDWSP